MPSPGVPADLPALVAARGVGIPIWSEIELASRFLRGKLVAITGSNGKTTTTALVGHILAGAGLPVIVAGNIGTPLISRVDDSSDTPLPWSRSAASSSSRSFPSAPTSPCCSISRPTISTATARLKTIAARRCASSKTRPSRDAAVLNADDPVLARQSPQRGPTSAGSAAPAICLPAPACEEADRLSRPARRNRSARTQRYRPARRTQCRKRSGCRVRRMAHRRASRGHRGGGAQLSRRRAPHRVCRRYSRRAVLQRLQGHQRGRHAEGPGRLSRRPAW